jgi:proteasome lid subunit RPN8/RPN11
VKCGARARSAIIEHAREADPAECCGILLGTAGEIVEAVRVRNIAESPTRYVLDPAEHIAVRRQARTRGLAELGFYHSHPKTAAEPSATDIAEAAYPGYLFMIVSLLTEPPVLRLFTWDGATFDPIALTDSGLWAEGVGRRTKDEDRTRHQE